jgi:hypothetical protein
MSETASTVIKLLSALVSPKNCVKYLSVAVSLVFSWVYVGEYIDALKVDGISISDQQSDIVILLVGVGIGGLVGFAIVQAYEKFLAHWESKKNIKRQEEQKETTQLDKVKADKQYTEEFKLAIDHLRASQVRTLRKLTNGRANIELGESENQILRDNGYIQTISCSHSTTYITQVNPLLNSFIIEHWKLEIEFKIERLYAVNSYANELLNLLKTENENSMAPVDTKYFESLSAYGDTCLHGDHDRHTNNKESPDYHLWFGEHDEDIIEALEKRNNTKYNGNLVIINSRLVNVETC